MHILIVEDDPLLSGNIYDMLKQEGFTTDVAYDGLAAEKMLRKGEYDCVVLDINMPHKNGYEICRQFRLYNTTTPVLFLTAFDQLEDKVQGFQTGGDDYLTKPFYMKELLLRIQSLVKRKATANSGSHSVVVADTIVLDQNAKSVKRDNVEISLTPREYQILLRLMLAKGQPVSKAELIREIWGSAFDANTNTIEVYINFLRNKVDKPFARPVIKTKVGFGYYLDIN